MDSLLMQMFQSVTQGPEALEKSLEQNKEKITPELASLARQAFKQAISEQDGQTATIAAVLASRLYGQLGDRFNELRNQIDFCQMRFMGAQTADEYTQVRRQALQLAEAAKSISSTPLAFESLTLAADCAYFASQESSGLESDDYLVTSLQDLLGAIEHADQVEHDGVFEKFVSLLTAVVDNSMSKFFVDPTQAKVDDLLKRLAPAIEKTIPVEYEFEGNVEKTANMASVLTQLADRYGN
jgi:hypothetical protein